MKFLKYAFLTLVIAVCADIALVYAYPIISATVINTRLTRNEAQFTDVFTKNTWSTQTYENLITYTELANPCPKCQISVQPYTVDGDYGPVVPTFVKGKYALNDVTSFSTPGDYKLKIWRHNLTLMETIHGARWGMNA